MTILTEIMMVMTILRTDLFSINNMITPTDISIAMLIEVISRSMTDSVMMMLMLWTILMTMDALTTWIVGIIVCITADAAV